MKKLKRVSTGCKGLDYLFKGGFIEYTINCVEGLHGSGKTTISIQFLLEGIKNGETVLFISLEENKYQIEKFFYHIWNDKINFLDISPSSKLFMENKIYDVFTPADVERDPLTQKIYSEIIRLKPTRVVIDSITQFKFLANNPYQFLKYMLSFFSFLRQNRVTTLFTSDPEEQGSSSNGVDIRYNVDTLFSLERGEKTNTLIIKKSRGTDFIKGRFEYVIGNNGVKVIVFPDINKIRNVIVKEEERYKILSSGIPSIDRLLGGGLPLGTVTMITGPSGVGKTTLMMQFIKEVSALNYKSIFYSFDERVSSIIKRCDSINLQISSLIEQKKIYIEEIFSIEHSVTTFLLGVVERILKNKIDVFVVDSVNSLFDFFSDDKDGNSSFNTLKSFAIFLKYLNKIGVTSFIIHEDSKVISQDFQATKYNITNLVDNLIFLRYIEIEGRMSKTIGMLKKRLGDFEKTLREFEITNYGIKVGEPWKDLEGLLTGIPRMRK